MTLKAMISWVCVPLGVKGGGKEGGRQGDGDPVTLKKFLDALLPLILLLLLPLLPLPSPFAPPSLCRNVADADDVTSFHRSPSSMLVHGDGAD